MNRYVSFHLDGRCYGIDLARVREVARVPAITPVPGAGEQILGLLNLRGQIVTVLDPGVCLGLPRREPGAEARMVILKTRADLAGAGGEAPADLTGLLVDDADDVVEVEPEMVEPPSANLGERETRCLAGLAKTPMGLLAILELRELLSGRRAPLS
jgi:purine-binding chemotaxis protein CheW